MWYQYTYVISVSSHSDSESESLIHDSVFDYSIKCSVTNIVNHDNDYDIRLPSITNYPFSHCSRFNPESILISNCLLMATDIHRWTCTDIHRWTCTDTTHFLQSGVTDCARFFLSSALSLDHTLPCCYTCMNALVAKMHANPLSKRISKLNSNMQVTQMNLETKHDAYK